MESVQNANIVKTFGKLSDESVELFLTSEGWILYGVLLDEAMKETEEKYGKVYKLLAL